MHRSSPKAPRYVNAASLDGSAVHRAMKYYQLVRRRRTTLPRRSGLGNAEHALSEWNCYIPIPLRKGRVRRNKAEQFRKN
uniref:Uncharacterized protein n=1 Tax=Moniliophthora roreri TaxID=221103 RepID=A0A0W0F708_MONRR